MVAVSLSMCTLVVLIWFVYFYFYVSYLKMFFASNVWCSLRLIQLKTEGQTNETELSIPPKSNKTQIKILANPGLAYSGFEQPGPGGLSNLRQLWYSTLRCS